MLREHARARRMWDGLSPGVLRLWGFGKHGVSFMILTWNTLAGGCKVFGAPLKEKDCSIPINANIVGMRAAIAAPADMPALFSSFEPINTQLMRKGHSPNPNPGLPPYSVYLVVLSLMHSWSRAWVPGSPGLPKVFERARRTKAKQVRVARICRDEKDIIREESSEGFLTHSLFTSVGRRPKDVSSWLARAFDYAPCEPLTAATRLHSCSCCFLSVQHTNTQQRSGGRTSSSAVL